MDLASVVLTTKGLQGIVELIKTGRMIYQRMITWILNKIVKTFQIVIFVIIAFLLTGEYVVSIFSIVLFLFLTDFVTLSISTDNVRYSNDPERWNINGLVKIAFALSVFLLIESIILLYQGQWYLGLKNIETLQTFIFNFLVFPVCSMSW